MKKFEEEILDVLREMIKILKKHREKIGKLEEFSHKILLKNKEVIRK